MNIRVGVTFTTCKMFVVLFVGASLFWGVRGLAAEALRTLKIPATSAEGQAYELKGLFLKPRNLSGPVPLVIVTHGAPINPEGAKNFNLESDLPQAQAISGFGYAVLLLQRRGFGSSPEPVTEFAGPCDHRDYKKSIVATDSDLIAGLKYFSDHKNREGVDSEKIALAGYSAHVFPRSLSRELFKIFSEAPGESGAEFWLAPAFEDEGHQLFSPNGVPIWKDRVQSFFKKIFK